MKTPKSPTISAIRQAVQTALHPSPTADLDAKLLVSYVLNCSVEYLYTHDSQIIPASPLQELHSLVARRLDGEPIAYIVGKQAFWDLELDVDKRVLIPRPETELLIDTLVTAFDGEPRRVLDVGTGSGAIILALARARPNWTLWASDVSPDALAVAQHNAKKYGLAQRIQWIEADMLTPFDKQTFDIIVANPPYIDVKDPHMDALQYEPQSALVSAQAGYAHLQSLISDAKVRLAPQGCYC